MPSTTPRHVTSHGRVPFALHRAGGNPGQCRGRVVGVNRGERPSVAGIEGLQEVGGLTAPDLPDDDMIGPVA